VVFELNELVESSASEGEKRSASEGNLSEVVMRKGTGSEHGQEEFSGKDSDHVEGFEREGKI